MAAPIVSGTVALMKSCKPEVSITEILPILRATGKRVSDYVPPMIQVDDALIALTTGVIPTLGDGGTVGDMPATPSDGPSNSDGQSPGDGGQSPGDGGQSPGDGGQSPGDGGQSPNDGSQSPGDVPVPADPDSPQPIEADPPAEEEADSRTDYEAIRKLIEFYKRKISELEKMLPENK